MYVTCCACNTLFILFCPLRPICSKVNTVAQIDLNPAKLTENNNNNNNAILMCGRLQCSALCSLRDGIPYCEMDYHAMFGIQCESCKKYITGKVLEVLLKLLEELGLAALHIQLSCL